jgi:hypothetical protein
MAEGAFARFPAGTAISVGSLAVGASWGDDARAAEKNPRGRYPSGRLPPG